MIHAEASLNNTNGISAAPASSPAQAEAIAAERSGQRPAAKPLSRLRADLASERAQRLRLEDEVDTVRAELAQTRAELADARADEAQARYLSRHDGLTALPNAGFFRECIDELFSRAEPRRQAMALMYLDLDDFKGINDLHGHRVGDEVLRIVATRLAHSVRADDMVCRLGGDEFACVLTNLPNQEQLSHLACKLFDAVATPMRIGSLDLSVRASIGIATYPSDGTTAATLLHSADAAMYGAKRAGNGYAFCKGQPAEGPGALLSGAEMPGAEMRNGAAP